MDHKAGETLTLGARSLGVCCGLSCSGASGHRSLSSSALGQAGSGASRAVSCDKDRCQSPGPLSEPEPPPHAPQIASELKDTISTRLRSARHSISVPIASTSDKVLGAALAGCELAWGVAKGTAEYAAGTRAGHLASGGADLALSGVEKVVECLLPPAKDESGTGGRGWQSHPGGRGAPRCLGVSTVSRGGRWEGGRGRPTSPREPSRARAAGTAAPLTSPRPSRPPAPAPGRQHPGTPPKTKPSLMSRVGALADTLSRHTFQTTAQVLRQGHALAMWVPGVSPLVSVCPEL